jgi:hypothetical protein
MERSDTQTLAEKPVLCYRSIPGSLGRGFIKAGCALAADADCASPSGLGFAEYHFHAFLIRLECRLSLCVGRIEDFDVQFL